ncbi:hypothetical protein IFM89_014260 [Coptis chinensis]|uniref:Uncharacterized protein n=1 Tax=Coptis chinensis TaxID=261450 RepID=A0A835H3L3_9MAGN|nr:hypothetical protein IFM89_014260 [Coptis chinensis]
MEFLVALIRAPMEMVERVINSPSHLANSVADIGIEKLWEFVGDARVVLERKSNQSRATSSSAPPQLDLTISPAKLREEKLKSFYERVDLDEPCGSCFRLIYYKISILHCSGMQNGPSQESLVGLGENFERKSEIVPINFRALLTNCLAEVEQGRELMRPKKGDMQSKIMLAEEIFFGTVIWKGQSLESICEEQLPVDVNASFTNCSAQVAEQLMGLEKVDVKSPLWLMTSPDEISHNEDVLRAFLMACEVKTVKLSVIGLSFLSGQSRLTRYANMWKLLETNKSIEIDPNCSTPYACLGFAYFSQGNYRDAIDKGFTKALQLDPDSASLAEYLQSSKGNWVNMLSGQRCADGAFGGAFPI